MLSHLILSRLDGDIDEYICEFNGEYNPLDADDPEMELSKYYAQQLNRTYPVHTQ